MHRTIYYDFTKCNLEVLEDFYYSIDEESRKKYLGEAVCNFLLWANELGNINHDEFTNIMQVFFPEPERIEYSINTPVFKRKLKKSKGKNIFSRLAGMRI